MASMIADNTLKDYLLRAKEVTEIRDAAGEVLGYYAPAAVADQIPVLRLLALFDSKELKWRKTSRHPGYSFEQVKEHLRLEAPPEFWRMIEERRREPTIPWEDIKAELFADEE